MLFLVFSTLLTRSIAQETVFLTSDAQEYALGETAYATAAVFNSLTRKPSTKTKILYLALLDMNKNLVQKRRFEIHNATASASIVIPNNLKLGTYFLTATTVNSDPEFNTVLPIRIIEKHAARYQLDHRIAYDQEADRMIAQFYPIDRFNDSVADMDLMIGISRNNGDFRRHKIKPDADDNFLWQLKRPDRYDLNYIEVVIYNKNTTSRYGISLPNPDESRVTLNLTAQHQSNDFLEIHATGYFGEPLNSDATLYYGEDSLSQNVINGQLKIPYDLAGKDLKAVGFLGKRFQLDYLKPSIKLHQQLKVADAH